MVRARFVFTIERRSGCRAVFRALAAQMAGRPGAYTLWPQTLRAAAEEIALGGKPDDAAEVLRWCRERYPAEAVCTTQPGLSPTCTTDRRTRSP